jgi:chromosome segregation ATPase
VSRTRSAQLEERERRVESTERLLISVQKRLASVEEFNRAAGGDALERLQSLMAERDSLGQRHFEVLSRRLEFVSELNDRLQPRLKRTLDELSGLDLESLQVRLNATIAEIDAATGQCAEPAEAVGDVDGRLAQIAAELSEVEDLLGRHQHEEEWSQRILQTRVKGIEAITTRISLLRQREAECLKQQKDIGALPDAEIPEQENDTSRELHRQPAGIDEEAKRLRHVNKRAIEQHRPFSAQQRELQAREHELRDRRNCRVIDLMI